MLARLEIALSGIMRVNMPFNATFRIKTFYHTDTQYLLQAKSEEINTDRVLKIVALRPSCRSIQLKAI